MATEITKEEWDEFVEVVTKSIGGHQDPTFIETVALALNEEIYNEYKVYH